MTNKIFLRIIYYQYNTGAGDNGFYPLDIECQNRTEAEAFKDKILTIKKHEQDRNWLSAKYGIDGYIERIDGCYQVITARLAA